MLNNLSLKLLPLILLKKVLCSRPRVYTPQQNGVTESKNRHLLDVTQALMIHINVLKCCWSDVILGICYLIIRIPSSVLNGASPHCILFPCSQLFSIPPRVFGCIYLLCSQPWTKI
jgi:hypothetical protein